MRGDSRQWVLVLALWGFSHLLRVVSPSLDFPFALAVLASSSCVFAHIVHAGQALLTRDSNSWLGA